MTTYISHEEQQTIQRDLQNYLKDMQQQHRVPPTPRFPTHEGMAAFLDQPTIMEMPAIRPVTGKLPRPKTDFESWLDGYIFAFWEKQHKFPHIVSISSIRKLEFIVEQLERQESPVRWHEYIFRHTNGWITIQLATKIMGYSEVECE